MLSFAEKYNWWSPKDSKQTLSLAKKIENLLEFGTLDELKKGIAEVGKESFLKVWNTCKNNPYAFKKRKKVLEVLLVPRRCLSQRTLPQHLVSLYKNNLIAQNAIRDEQCVRGSTQISVHTSKASGTRHFILYRRKGANLFSKETIA